MNKRADMTIMILVIGVIAVCALAIFSFLSSSFSKTQSFVGVAMMEELNAKIEEHAFYKNAGVSESEIEEILGIEDGTIYMEKNTRDIPLLKKAEFLFSVEYSRIP